MSGLNEDIVYRRIGEFVVCFQWLENKIREIGWFILDPDRKEWPPRKLREESTALLFKKVQKLFLDALPRCDLGPELEQEFRVAFVAHAARFEAMRRTRNRILHSAYIEMKAGGEVVGLLRSNPKLQEDPETGKPLFDQEALSGSSFDAHIIEMGHLAMFFGRCYIQLLHRLPHP